MKKLLIIIFIPLFLSFNSCKKDYELNEALLVEHTLFPDFFVQGTIIDHENNVSIPFDVRTNISNPTVGSISYSGILHDGKKSMASSTGYYPQSTVVPPMEEEDKFYVNGSLRVKIVSGIDGSDTDFMLTKNELLDLFEEGDVLSFGIGAGQVEVSFHHFSVDTYPEFEERGYTGHTDFSQDTSFDTFEILKVEDYVNNEISEPATAIIVTAKINCTLVSPTSKLMSLEDVETTLFFEYN